MAKFLIDENLTPKLAELLREFKYQAVHVNDVNLNGKDDLTIIDWLIENKSVLITKDLEFAEVYYRFKERKFGVIVVRTKEQNYSILKQVILKLHEEKILKSKKIVKKLIIADVDKIILQE